MVRTTRSEINIMATTVIDEDTGMTLLDLWEYSHSFDDIEIIEDVESTEDIIKDILKDIEED
jgi:hypothetical protein